MFIFLSTLGCNWVNVLRFTFFSRNKSYMYHCNFWTDSNVYDSFVWLKSLYDTIKSGTDLSVPLSSTLTSCLANHCVGPLPCCMSQSSDPGHASHCDHCWSSLIHWLMMDKQHTIVMRKKHIHTSTAPSFNIVSFLWVLPVSYIACKPVFSLKNPFGLIVVGCRYHEGPALLQPMCTRSQACIFTMIFLAVNFTSQP